MKKLLVLAGLAGLLAACSAPDYGRGGAAYEGNVYHNSHDPAYFHGGDTNVLRNAPVSPDVAPLANTNIPPAAVQPEPVPTPEPSTIPEPVPAHEPGNTPEPVPAPEPEPQQ